MVDRYEHFIYAINEISKHWRRLAGEEMERHGLKAPHSIYFIALARHPEGLTASQLCEYTGRDKADVSRMVATMEEKGLVEKVSNPQKRYNGVYRLTEQSVAIAAAVEEKVCRVVAQAGKDLSEADRNTFYTVLDSIVTNLRALSTAGPSQ